jgi:hypothetical protein
MDVPPTLDGRNERLDVLFLVFLYRRQLVHDDLLQVAVLAERPAVTEVFLVDVLEALLVEPRFEILQRQGVVEDLDVVFELAFSRVSSSSPPFSSSVPSSSWAKTDPASVLPTASPPRAPADPATNCRRVLLYEPFSGRSPLSSLGFTTESRWRESGLL